MALVPYGTRAFCLAKKGWGRMGKLIARELDELKWGLAGCLLFIGISSPAFHQFYKKSWWLSGVRGPAGIKSFVYHVLKEEYIMKTSLKFAAIAAAAALSIQSQWDCRHREQEWTEAGWWDRSGSRKTLQGWHTEEDFRKVVSQRPLRSVEKIVIEEGEFSETYFFTIIPYNNVIK